jgi:hypothetical protein
VARDRTWTSGSGRVTATGSPEAFTSWLINTQLKMNSGSNCIQGLDDLKRKDMLLTILSRVGTIRM